MMATTAASKKDETIVRNRSALVTPLPTSSIVQQQQQSATSIGSTSTDHGYNRSHGINQNCNTNSNSNNNSSNSNDDESRIIADRSESATLNDYPIRQQKRQIMNSGMGMMENTGNVCTPQRNNESSDGGCGNAIEAQQFFGAEWIRNPDGTPLLDHNNDPIPIGKMLATKPLRSELSTRPGPGNKKLTYMSGDMVTRILNDLFGFDGWCLDIKNTNREGCNKDDKGRFHVSYTATVRVTHRRSGAYKEDCGAGDSTDRSMATAVSHALKASVTDAMKRAVRHFGEKLGNSLYESSFSANKAPVTLKDALTRHDIDRATSKFGFEKDRKPRTITTPAVPEAISQAIKTEPNTGNQQSPRGGGNSTVHPTPIPTKAYDRNVHSINGSSSSEMMHGVQQQQSHHRRLNNPSMSSMAKPVANTPLSSMTTTALRQGDSNGLSSSSIGQQRRDQGDRNTHISTLHQQYQNSHHTPSSSRGVKVEETPMGDGLSRFQQSPFQQQQDGRGQRRQLPQQQPQNQTGIVANRYNGLQVTQSESLLSTCSSLPTTSQIQISSMLTSSGSSLDYGSVIPNSSNQHNRSLLPTSNHHQQQHQQQQQQQRSTLSNLENSSEIMSSNRVTHNLPTRGSNGVGIITNPIQGGATTNNVFTSCVTSIDDRPHTAGRGRPYNDASSNHPTTDATTTITTQSNLPLQRQMKRVLPMGVSNIDSVPAAATKKKVTNNPYLVGKV